MKRSIENRVLYSWPARLVIERRGDPTTVVPAITYQPIFNHTQYRARIMAAAKYRRVQANKRE